MLPEDDHYNQNGIRQPAMTGAKLWKKALIELEKELTPVSYNNWINKLIPSGIENNTFILFAPDETNKYFIEKRYMRYIISALERISNTRLDVKIEINSLETKALIANARSVTYSEGRIAEREPPEKNASILSRYTFDNFVKGKCNELAFEASCAVAEQPGQTSYNPLFLYGGVGLGKTHLMHSIGNYILGFDPYMKIIYTTSENLVNHFVTSIKNREPEKFRERFRNVDVLMVDDVQFLLDKERSQEEFFHTFNALFSESKQIILSSDKPPSQLKSLEDRLSSRFGQGLVVDITQPDYETRLAILEKKAEIENIHIPPEVLDHLAKTVSSNIRELEGLFIKTVAEAKLKKIDVSMELAMKVIKEMTEVDFQKRELDIQLILEIVGERYNVTPDEIRSKKRPAPLAYARHIAMFLARKILSTSLISIGKDFGGRDHSTVIHAADKITNEMESNADLILELENLEEKIREAVRS